MRGCEKVISTHAETSPAHSSTDIPVMAITGGAEELPDELFLP
jgi:hypothetical protein